MKAYNYHTLRNGIRLTNLNPTPSLKYPGNIDSSGPAYLRLRSHPSSRSGRHDIKLDDQNPPRVEWIGPVSAPYVRECGIIVRTVGSQFERALIAGKPGDNRALLHIDYVPSELRPYLDKGFPEIVDMIGPAEAAQAGYEVTDGYSYLLIFKLGDTIQGTQGIEQGAQGIEEAILQWDGNQFKKIGPPKRNEPKPGVWKEL